MKEDEKAISELSGSCLTLSNNGEYSRPVGDFIFEFHDSTAFALVLAAELHQSKESGVYLSEDIFFVDLKFIFLIIETQ